MVDAESHGKSLLGEPLRFGWVKRTCRGAGQFFQAKGSIIVGIIVFVGLRPEESFLLCSNDCIIEDDVWDRLENCPLLGYKPCVVYCCWDSLPVCSPRTATLTRRPRASN